MRNLVLALSLVCACTRSLELPTRAVRSTGTPCDTAAQCVSGVCADGVCCGSACAASETCAAPGRVGACTARPLGAACSGAAACPSGHCVDGVCCESACAGSCMTCDAQGDARHPAGICASAPANTDARRDCGLCNACFDGACAPAEVGTDPNHSCGSGQVCGASSTCGLPSGASCAADAECAVGACFAGKCEVLSVERAFAEPMVGNPSGRSLRGLAVSSAGAVALVVGEWSSDDQGSYFENDLFVLTRSPSGGYAAADLFSDRPQDGGPNLGRIPAGVAYLGPTAFVATYSSAASSGTCPAAASATPCGVFGQLVPPPGNTPGRTELIDTDARAVLQLELREDSAHELYAIYEGVHAPDAVQVPRVFVAKRSVGASGSSWSVVAGIDVPYADSSYGWSAEILDGRPVVVFTHINPNEVVAHRLAPADPPVAATLPDFGASGACQPDAVVLRRTGTRGAEQAVLSFFCGQAGVVAGTWAPGSPFSLNVLEPSIAGAFPLGLVQGLPAFVVGRDTGAPLVTEVDYASLRADGSLDTRTLYVPRGMNDVTFLQGVLDASGLPVAALTSGPRTNSGGVTTIQSLDVFLARLTH